MDANKFIVIVIIIDIVLGVNGHFNSNIGITGIPILAYKWPFSSNFGTDIILVKVVLEMELFVKGTELGIFPETVLRTTSCRISHAHTLKWPRPQVWVLGQAYYYTVGGAH